MIKSILSKKIARLLTVASIGLFASISVSAAGNAGQESAAEYRANADAADDALHDANAAAGNNPTPENIQSAADAEAAANDAHEHADAATRSADDADDAAETAGTLEPDPDVAAAAADAINQAPDAEADANFANAVSDAADHSDAADNSD